MATRPAKLSAQILDEASTWFTELTAGAMDAASQVEFNGWLRRSPEHVQAYLQIAALWEDAGVLEKRRPLDLDALIGRARRDSNVYPFEIAGRAEAANSAAVPAATSASRVPAAQAGESGKPAGRTRRALWAVAASVLLVSIAASWQYLQRGVYATEIGEQRFITLDDGSSVELNARSRLEVRFTESQRHVELLAGQALFHVAKDSSRPFVVKSGETQVRAVGTSFDIYRKHGDTIVTVVEGRVAVASPESAAPSAGALAEASEGRREVLLQAGEQLTVSIPSPAPRLVQPQPRRANVAVATAWTEKKLVFEGVPLRDVVEEFNRYNRRQLVIRDPVLADFHMSGVFASTDSARILEVLRRRFGVTLTQSADQIEISRAAQAPAAPDATP